MPNQINFNPLRAVGLNGDPSAGAKAYFYETGTSTPITVYTNDGLGTAHPTPLVADGQGVFAPAFTDGATAVKVDVTTSGGGTLNGYPIDPVQLISSTGSAAAAVTFAPITGNAATNVQSAIQNLTTLWNAVTTYGKSIMAAADAAATRTLLGLGTAAVANTGTADGQVVVLNATGLPAVDGSLLTNTPTRLKAFVNFDGSGTVAIRASLNVSSITDNGTGSYDVNFTTPLADANYTAVPSARGPGVGVDGVATLGGSGDSYTTSKVSVYTLAIGGTAFAAQDATIVNVAIFR